MSVTFGFFNAELVNGDYDRKYTADQLAEFFSYLLGNGISASDENNFKVSPDSGFNVSVAAGFAWIKGFWVKSDSSFNLTDTAVPSSGYRKDFIVLRFNRTDRTISPMLIQGEISQVAPASEPEYVRTAEIYDLVLARISVEAGDSSISSSMIEDLRQDTTYCGIVDTFSERLLPAGSVQSSALAPGSVTTEKLAPGAVTSNKMEDECVIGSKLANSVVTENKLGTGSVTESKLASNSVSFEKIKSMTVFSISSSDDKGFEISTNSRAIVLLSGYNTGSLISLARKSTGSAAGKVIAGTGFSTTTLGSNTVFIENSSGTAVSGLLIVLSGTVNPV